MLKTSENPPILYPEGCSLEEIRGQWWVAHVKSRNEKALAWNLSQWKIPYFLPLVEKKSRRKGRTYKTLMPIFSGYMFFCGDLEQRHQAFTTNRIAQTIEVVDQKLLVDELVPIYQAITSGLAMDCHQQFEAGKRCRVTGGPLMGAEGVVIRQKNQCRILLEVKILGQAAAVEVDADLLEEID